MQISKYTPTIPHPAITSIIQNLFLTQQIRNFKVQKPQKSSTTSSTSKCFADSDEILKKVNVNTHPLKQKIIQKVKSQSINRRRQKQLQRSHNNYLINFLHKTNKLGLKRGIPAQLSILETIDEGDYIDSDMKKDYPHFSNTLQLTQLPAISKTMVIKEPLKAKMGKQHLFPLQSNIVFKIKIIFKIIDAFETIGNDQFQPLAQKLGVATRNIKLLYDLLTDVYNIERALSGNKRNNIQYQQKIFKNMRVDLRECLGKLKTQQSSQYIPADEQFISLYNLRIAITYEEMPNDSRSQ